MDTLEAFRAIELRVGVVLEATANEQARVPAYVLRIDFGAAGVKTSSAQITERYQPADLVGRQVVAVTNLPPRRIAGVTSEVLILGAMEEGGVNLLRPDLPAPPGTRVL